MKNIEQLIQGAVDVFQDSRNTKMSAVETNAQYNTLGVIVKAIKLKLEYKKHQGDHSKIEFLED